MILQQEPLTTKTLTAHRPPRLDLGFLALAEQVIDEAHDHLHAQHETLDRPRRLAIALRDQVRGQRLVFDDDWGFERTNDGADDWEGHEHQKWLAQAEKLIDIVGDVPDEQLLACCKLIRALD